MCLADERWRQRPGIAQAMPDVCSLRGGDSPFQIAVHDGEEDLQEQVDGVYQHRQKVQPCFASHCEEVVCSVVRGLMGLGRGSAEADGPAGDHAADAIAVASEVVWQWSRCGQSCVCRLRARRGKLARARRGGGGKAGGMVGSVVMT